MTIPIETIRSNLTNCCIGRHGQSDKRFLRFAGAALLVVLACATPGQACAGVRSSDRVGGTSYSELGLPRAAMPDVSMQAGALVTSDGRVLWSRDPNKRRAMASITKIMTAVVAMENSQPDDVVQVPRRSTRIGESTSFLRPGEKLPMSELLEALLVKSGNDAAVAIAEHVSGTEDAFVKRMNAKAGELGLAHTRFANAHGLDQKGHYSSAEDLAVLARYAMTKPAFREIVAKKTARIGKGKRSEKVESTNLLLGNYAGANGVKTGWTDRAGYSVLNSAMRGKVELYAVVLGAASDLGRFKDARELLDFGFAHYRELSLGSAGTVIGEAPVTDYLDVTVPAAVSQNTTVAVFDLAGPVSRTVAMSAVRAPVMKGQRIGVATFTQRGEVVASVPLLAVESVPRPTVLQRIGIAIVRGWRRLTGTTSEPAQVGAGISESRWVS